MTASAMLLTVNEAALRLGIGRSLAYRLVMSGDIASIKVGPRLRRVPATALDDYIDLERQREDDCRG